MFCKPLESEGGGHGADSDEPVFLKQLPRKRTHMPDVISAGRPCLLSASLRPLNCSVRVFSCVGVAMANVLSVMAKLTTSLEYGNAFPTYCSFSRRPPRAPRQRFPASPERHFRHQRMGRCPLS